MTLDTRSRDRRQPKRILCTTEDPWKTNPCTFLSGHDGRCSWARPSQRRCDHLECMDDDGHIDFCLYEDWGGER